MSEEEFGRYGIERLGGEQSVRRKICDGTVSLFEQYQTLREKLIL